MGRLLGSGRPLGALKVFGVWAAPGLHFGHAPVAQKMGLPEVRRVIRDPGALRWLASAPAGGHRGADPSHRGAPGSRGTRRISGSPYFEPMERVGWMVLKSLKLFKGRESVMLGVWAAPGAPETLAQGGGRSPPPFGRVSGVPGPAQTPDPHGFKKFIIPAENPNQS